MIEYYIGNQEIVFNLDKRHCIPDHVNPAEMYLNWWLCAKILSFKLFCVNEKYINESFAHKAMIFMYS